MVYDPDEARRIGSYKGGQAAAISLARIAREFYEPLIPIAVELHEKGLSLRAIADEFVKRGIKAAQGSTCWSAAQVRRILIRAGKQPSTRPSNEAATPEQVPPTIPALAAAEPVPADILLWLNSEWRGHYTKDEVKDMWTKGEVKRDTPIFREADGESRALFELFE